MSIHDRQYDRAFNGIEYASKEGGMLIEIQASGLAETPSHNSCEFYALDSTTYPKTKIVTLDGKEELSNLSRGAGNFVVASPGAPRLSGPTPQYPALREP